MERKMKLRRGFKISDYEAGKVRSITIPETGESLNEWVKELDEMVGILLGRGTPPLDAGVSTLLELADAYYARAAEMTMKIQRAEREGTIDKTNPFYKFRTGELRTFMDMAKRSAETGSRRLTKEQLRYQQSTRGLESEGFEDGYED